MISDNLMLNDEKTEFLIIGTRQQLAKVNINCIRVGSTDVCPVTVARNLQWATKVVETLLENDAFRYLSICSILFASSVNSLIPPAPQFNVV